MTERYYAVEAGDGVWVYRLELDGYESAVKVEGALLKKGQKKGEPLAGPEKVRPEDFVRNVVNNGLREATRWEIRLLNREREEDEEEELIYLKPQDDLDEALTPAQDGEAGE